MPRLAEVAMPRHLVLTRPYRVPLRSFVRTGGYSQTVRISLRARGAHPGVAVE